MPKKFLDLEEEGGKVKVILDLLFNKAFNGSKKSAGLLWRIAMFSTDYLQKLARDKPEVIKLIAATQHKWPGFIGPHPDMDKRSRELVELLGVGSNSEIKLHSKTRIWSQDAYANEVALNYYYLFDTIKTRLYSIYAFSQWTEPLAAGLCLPDDSPINKHEWRMRIKDLPDLKTPIDQDQWFDAIWDFILEEYKGHPEKQPVSLFPNKSPDDLEFYYYNLWKLGEHREYHAEDQGHQKKQTPGTSAADIRSAIKDRLKRAFTTIF